jgi:hypothetical protein
LDHVDTSSSAEKTTGLVLSPPCDPAATDGIFQSLVELSFPLPQDKEPAEIVPVENENPVPIDKFRVPVLRGMTEYIKSSAWKLFFVLTAAAFAVSLCAYVWVNMDRKMQQEKLQQTYVSFNKLITKYEEAKNQAKLYEVDMMTWRLEAQRSKNALMNSETELQNTRKNLFEVKKELENVRRENTEALKELNDKITSIREHIPAVAEQPAQ